MAVPLPNNRCRAFFDLPNQNCSQCNNANGIFKCDGCGGAFCEQHVTEHRGILKAQLRELRQSNETLQTEVNDTMFRTERQRLIKEIDAWEAQSIDKIKKVADEARRKVGETVSISGHSQVKQLLDCREVFTARLQQAETNSDFHERHLEFWKQFLEDLRQNFTRLRTSYARIEYCKVAFIEKICIRESAAAIYFTKWCYYQRKCGPHTDIRRSHKQQECAQFIGIEPCDKFYEEDCGEVVNRRVEISQQRNSRQYIDSDPPENYYAGGESGQVVSRRVEVSPQRFSRQFHDLEARETSYAGNDDQVIELTQSTYQALFLDTARELLTGEYRFRLNTGCLFIGIISKSANWRRESLNTRSVYGWNGDNTVYLDGVAERGYRGYQSDMQMGDTISLIIDCEQEMIQLTNVTKNRTHELAVDVEKCPLPWLLKIRFYE